MKPGIETQPLLLIGALAAIVAALGACQKPLAEGEPEPESLPLASPARTTPPPAAPFAVASTPSPDELAPPGIFFLLKKTSITTDEGIIGLKPGQGLRLLSPGIYEASGHQIPLRADQVTNNLRIARQHAAADAMTQTALRQAMQPPPASPPPAAPVRTAAPTPASAPAAPARPPLGQSSALSSGTRLGAGTGAADPETANRRNVKVDSSGRQYWRDSRGGIRYDF